MAEDLKLATMAPLQLWQVAVQADRARATVIEVPRDSAIGLAVDELQRWRVRAARFGQRLRWRSLGGTALN